MTYADIADVALGDLIDETTFNQILANLRALYNAPSGAVSLDLPSDKTVSSGGAFADIDSANLSITFTLDAVADVLIGFQGTFVRTVSTGTTLYLNVAVDSVAVQANDGLVAADLSSQSLPQSLGFVYLATSLPAGSHTFRVQWKVVGSSTGARLYAGAGTSNADLHPHFFAKVV
jgi:hypothetical protein